MPDGFQQPALWALLGSAFDEEPIIFQTLLLHRLFWKSIQILLWTSLKMSLLPDLKKQIWIISKCKNSQRWDFHISGINPAPTFPHFVGSPSACLLLSVHAEQVWNNLRVSLPLPRNAAPATELGKMANPLALQTQGFTPLKFSRPLLIFLCLINSNYSSCHNTCTCRCQFSIFLFHVFLHYTGLPLNMKNNLCFEDSGVDSSTPTGIAHFYLSNISNLYDYIKTLLRQRPLESSCSYV